MGRHEVALIELRDADGGIRVLGRSGDRGVVEFVERHLVASIRGRPTSGPPLRVLDGALDSDEVDQ
jgi:hypothetical protein